MLKIFEDPIIAEKLNPLFLQDLHKFWTIVSESKHENPKKILSVQKHLLTFLFRRLFQPIYLKHFPKIEGTLFCLTTVGRGLGDYFANLKSAKTLKQTHPESNVHVVFTHQVPLPAINPSDYFLKPEWIHGFLETSDRPILEPVLEGVKTLPFEIKLEELLQARSQVLQDYEEIIKKHNYPVQSLADLIADYDCQIQHLQQFAQIKNKAEGLYEMMISSQAIIHTSLAINTFENPILASKSLYFAEAGNFQGIANYLRLNWFSMGLASFEEGIFLRKTFTKTSFVSADTGKHSIHVAYLPKISEYRLIFINLVCLMQKDDPRPIEIFLPLMEEDEPFRLNPDWLAHQGISEVTLVDKHGAEHPLFYTGLTPIKVLRLVQAFPMPPTEFEELVALSGEVVGCTGDGSLSDCLIAGKIPFYELRKHKLEIWQGFQVLAEHFQLNLVSKFLQIQENYKDLKEEIVAEHLFILLQNENFKMQWNKLIEVLHKYYCFEDALVSHVNRHVIHHQFPVLNALEEQLVENYFEGHLSISQAIKILNERLDFF